VQGNFNGSWDVSEQFPTCASANPSGQWSFGYAHLSTHVERYPSEMLTLFGPGKCSVAKDETAVGSVCLHQTFGAAPFGDIVRIIGKDEGPLGCHWMNISAIPSNGVAMHPAAPDIKTIIRWTVPSFECSRAFYKISIQFYKFVEPQGDTDAAVFVDGNRIWFEITYA
jgi:hypothetical protein